MIRPTIATVYLTKYCNSRCTMCDFWKHDHDPEELTSEQWGIVFSRLKAFGVGFIGVNASGEMFTRRDVLDILGHLNDLGLRYGVNSNGTLFTPIRSRKFAALNPSQVTIGLDGIGNESYFVTRGLKNGFTKISRNLDNLKSAGIKNIYIGSVLMRDNLKDWINICQFAIDKGISGVRFTAFHENYFNPDEPNKQKASSDHRFIAEVEAEIEKLIQLKRMTGVVKNSEEYLLRIPAYYRNPATYFPKPCLQGSNRIEIDVFGNVTLCSFVTDSLGNLLRQEMEEIWSSEQHRRAREAAFSGNCPKCFLSCYAEENLRLVNGNVLSVISSSLQRAHKVLGST